MRWTLAGLPVQTNNASRMASIHASFAVWNNVWHVSLDCQIDGSDGLLVECELKRPGFSIVSLDIIPAVLVSLVSPVVSDINLLEAPHQVFVLHEEYSKVNAGS